MPHMLQLQYIAAIKACYDLRDKFPEEELTAFWGRKGLRSTGELMVIGRAVNGWDDLRWKKDKLNDESEIHPLVVKMRQMAESGDKCPMNWIHEYWQRADGNYNVARSAFWRVIKSAVLSLERTVSESDWPSHVMWSNLYKISPATAGNPSSGLLRLQQEHCGNILLTEVSRWQPKRILMLTGRDWADWFLKKLDARPAEVGGFKYVQWIGTIELSPSRPISIVVGPHPQGKPEASLVTEIVKAFS